MNTLHTQTPVIAWSKEQADLLTFLRESDQSVFITGDPGTGKTTILKAWLASLETQNETPDSWQDAQDAVSEKVGYTEESALAELGVVVLAPTGIAALNLEGSTIHKFFSIPPQLLSPYQVGEYLRPAAQERLSKVKTLVIDEVSMVRADVFAVMDKMLQFAQYNKEPFGGVRIVLVGDLMQLPPVVRDDEKEHMRMLGSANGWFFATDAYRALAPKRFNLKKSFRQSDKSFIQLLSRVRNGDRGVAGSFNKLVKDAKKAPKGTTYLSTTNRGVDELNIVEFEKLPGEKSLYEGIVQGEIVEKSLPVPVQNPLGVGARVIALRNSLEYVNGSLGTVIELKDESVVVEFDNGATCDVGYAAWEFCEYKVLGGNIQKIVKGSIKQIPLKLAWAITIHRCQGQTLDSAIIDMGNRAFAHGQLYVALSRLRTLEGMYFKRKIRPSDIVVDAEAWSFLREEE